MQITPSPMDSYRLPIQSELPPDSNDHQVISTHQRHKRTTDAHLPSRQAPATGTATKEVRHTYDPGKGVDVGQKAPVLVNLGANPSIDSIAEQICGEFNSVEQEASNFLSNLFAEKKAKAKNPAEKDKWSVDPDNTYLVTFDYNTSGDRPYPAKIIQKISLTQALIKNAQDTPAGKGYAVPFYAGGPEVILKPELQTLKPSTFDFSSRINPYSEQADITHTYQGIYVESEDEPAPVYNGGNQSLITPDEFKALIWKADYQKPYKAFLDSFWSSHKEKYPAVAKASFIKSAITQQLEGSLSPEGRNLIMRAAGVPDVQASWPDINAEDLQKNPPKDPTIDMGLLKLGSYQSTDLMYITDTKKTPALTLLYIPGNSSPIHSFSSQAEMKAWLAREMADPVKLNALASHFALKDKPNGFTETGIDETLAGLGTWPQKRETPGGRFSYDHLAFSGSWDPQQYIKLEANNLPFDEIAKRQKDRSYADADVKITSDADLTKDEVLSGLEKTTKAALFLTPLALVVPEVALALDAFYLVDGAVTTVIGIDDTVQGKPNGTERIVFGALNAAQVMTPLVVRNFVKSGELGIEAFLPNKSGLHEEPAPGSTNRSEEPDSNAAFDTSYSQRQLPDYSAHAMPDDFLEGKTRRGDGTYQVGDDFYVKFTDGTGVSRAFEVERFYKGNGSPIRVIDPASKTQVMMLVPTENGEWRLANLEGGVKSKVPSVATKPPLVNHPDWQNILDSGEHNGQPVYIHYTSKAGAEAIAKEQSINDLARGERRAGSKGGVYVNPPGQQFNGDNVENLLFLGNERYKDSGNYRVIFSTDQPPTNLGPVTQGSPFVELKMQREIKLTASNLLYLGPNTFPDYFA